MSITSLPGTRVAPATLLHKTLEQVSEIKAVAVIVQWNDDVVSTEWSTLNFGELAYMARILDIDVTDYIKGDRDEGTS